MCGNVFSLRQKANEVNGENGHLAFNDPPADIDTNRAYKVIPLDDKCRMQQVGEGWFAKKEDVPTHAFSMSMKQILWSKSIVCTCPDSRKADAVVGAVEGPVTNMLPSSFMQLHPDCAMFLILRLRRSSRRRTAENRVGKIFAQPPCANKKISLSFTQKLRMLRSS